MKIKSDFVTNSSSTSYCMWCVYQTVDEFPEKLKKLIYNEYITLYNNKKLLYDEFLVELESFPSRFRGAAINVLYKFGIKYAIEFDQYYIGDHLENMSDDQTLREFKNSIIEKLKQLDIDRGLRFMIFEMEDYTPEDEEDE